MTSETDYYTVRMEMCGLIRFTQMTETCVLKQPLMDGGEIKKENLIDGGFHGYKGKQKTI